MEPLKQKRRKVGRQGQVTLKKRWSGKDVLVDQVSATEIRVRLATVVPMDHRTFYTEKAMAQLKEFEDYSKKTPPRKTDLKELKASIVKKATKAK